MFSIYSQRLTLIPLNTEQLLLLQKNRDLLTQSLGLNPSEIRMNAEIAAELNDAIPYWISHTSQYPERYMWFTHWEIVYTGKNESIGGIGMSSWPNHNGETMIGYVIDNRHHNQGIATEAVECLLDWMWQNPELRTVTADTPRDNYPSQRVLRKNGFEICGEDETLLHWRKRRHTGA
ncbi:MAG: GNAT family N-acetyltransferase [Bacteroidia bacterium]